jgi:hypothetical protein
MQVSKPEDVKGFTLQSYNLSKEQYLPVLFHIRDARGASQTPVHCSERSRACVCEKFSKQYLLPQYKITMKAI